MGVFLVVASCEFYEGLACVSNCYVVGLAYTVTVSHSTILIVLLYCDVILAL